MPWDRQPDESEKSFAAFAAYRDMGEKRSCAKVAQKLGKTRTLICRWSTQHNWVDRVDAWDAEQDRLLQKQLGKQRVKAQKNIADTASVLLGKALQSLQITNPASLKPADITRFIDTAIKANAAAYGGMETGAGAGADAFDDAMGAFENDDKK